MEKLTKKVYSKIIGELDQKHSWLQAAASKEKDNDKLQAAQYRVHRLMLQVNAEFAKSLYR